MPHLCRKHVVCCVLCYVLKCCQDVPSFGRKHVVCCPQVLSRCPIFRQKYVLCVVLKCCQDAPSFGRKYVVCCVLSSSAVKMPHLSAGSMLCVVCCPQVLSRCPIFRQEVCCVLCVVLKCCQDAPSFGRKHVVCCVLSSSAIKMSHLSAVPCQDAPSFGREACCVLCVVLKCCQDAPSFGREACCVLCVVLKCCQDAPSFGRKQVLCCVTFCMSSRNVLML